VTSGLNNLWQRRPRNPDHRTGNHPSDTFIEEDRHSEQSRALPALCSCANAKRVANRGVLCNVPT
jgi:hypothetical protein